MRLKPEQVEITKQTVRRLVGEGSRVWLFGSRVDDSLRGGDIDLLVETDRVVPNRVQTLCKLHGALIRALGERKLDILLQDARTKPAPVFDIAKRTGALL